MSNTLGASIKTGRENLGLTQADLATRVGVSQQTIARWERGNSTPSPAALEKLSAIVGLEDVETRAAEERTTCADMPTPPVRPLVGRLPLDELTPGDFERFTHDVVGAVYGDGADVHRVGGPGHSQGGADVIAENTPDGRVIFQCKRVSRGGRFGPAMVCRAVAGAAETAADKRVLVLSRVASPQARQAARDSGWDIWDHDDLVRLLQVTLDLEPARRVVRTFFPGYAREFLGLASTGPWLSLEEMYAGQLEGDALFSHAWALLGRDAELAELMQWLESDEQGSPHLLVAGPAGIGKSRVVIELARRTPRGMKVWFVDTNVEVRPEDFETLGEGAALLIVEDAHDRQDVEVILRGALLRRGKASTRVVLTTRPYGEGHLASVAARVDAGRLPRTIKLARLSPADARALAADVLGASPDSPHVHAIAAVAGDSTMLTVATAFLLREKRINPSLMASEAELRSTVLGAWVTEYVEALRDLPASLDAHDLLRAIAAVQPLELGSSEQLSALGSLIGMEQVDEVVRVLDKAVAAGVASRRAGRLRIMPDMLADYLLADACYSLALARTTGFADRAWHIAPPSLRRNLLVNLSRVDWQLSTTDPAAGSLIDTAWSSLEADFRNAGIQERAALLSLVAEIAYYQPRRSVEFVRWALTNQIEGLEAGFLGRPVTYTEVQEAIPKVLRGCAYHLDHLDESLDLLWELAKRDRRPTNPHPDHALRVLSDLASFSLLKPFEYSKRVIERALGWLEYDAHPAVFEVLGEAVKWDAEDHIADGFSLHMRSYSVLHVAPEEDLFALRRQVLDACVQAMACDDVAVALGAIRCVESALRKPGGLFGREAEDREKEVWEIEAASTLGELLRPEVLSGFSPLVKTELLTVADSLASCHSERIREQAEALLSAIGDDLDVDVAEALAHGPWRRERGARRQDTDEDEQRWLKSVAHRLIDRECAADTVTVVLEKALEEASASGAGTTPGPLVAALVELDDGIAQSIVARVGEDPRSALLAVVGTALAVYRKKDPKGALGIADGLFETADVELRRQVAHAYGWGLGTSPAVAQDEIDLIHRLAADEDLFVARSVTHGLRFLAASDPAAAIEILLALRIGRSPDLADDSLVLFTRREPLSLEYLRPEQLKELLDELLVCPSIDEYWIEQFLGLVCERDMESVVKLLKGRVERAEQGDYSYDEYRPLPFGWENKSPLSTEGHPERARQLQDLLGWASADVPGWRRHFDGPKLFAAVAGVFDDEVLSLFALELSQRALPEAKRIAHILSEVPRAIIWERVDWIGRVLEAAAGRDVDLYRAVTSALYSAVISGVRSGTPGQPYPQDLEQRDRARAVADGIPRGSATERFYRSLQRSAEADIIRSLERDEELS